MSEEPIQTAWCFICGVEIRRSTVPPAIWVHNDMDGLREHTALPDVDEAVRDAIAAAVQRVEALERNTAYPEQFVPKAQVIAAIKGDDK